MSPDKGSRPKSDYDYISGTKFLQSAGKSGHEKNRMFPCGSGYPCFPAQAAFLFGLPNLRQSMALPTSATPKISVPMPG